MEASEYNNYAGSQAKETIDTEVVGKKTDQAILNDIKIEFRRAKNAKDPIEGKIDEWNKAYEGELYGNEVDNRSKVVMRDVAKAIEGQKPNITEPFTSTDNPVGAKPLNSLSDKAAQASEGVLNYQFTTQFDRYTFMDTLADILPRE